MTVADNDVLRVVASMLWTDANVNQNVYNCLVSGGGGPYADTDVIDDMEDWLDSMYGNLTTIISDLLDGNEVIVYKYDTVGADWDEVGSQSWSWNPSYVQHQLPRGVAALVRLWTVDPDVQGKKYMPGTTEESLDNGLFDSTMLTALLAFALDWYTPFVGITSGATFTPGIWSVVGALFNAAVNHYATSAIPAYQRRRKRNVGI